MIREPVIRKHAFLTDILRYCLRSANRLGAGLDRYLGKTGNRTSEPLFIVGLPRSGTTLAYEVIIQAFHVAYFSKIYSYTFGMPNLTTRLFSRLMKNPHAHYRSKYGSIPGLFSPAENHNFWMRWFPERPTLGHHVASTSLSKNDVSEINEILSSIGGIAERPFVFKDVYLSLSLEALLSSVNQGRILLITREHEAVAASVFKRRSELQGQLPWWSIRPPFSEDVLEKDLIEQVAFQCVRSEQLLQQQLSNADPARYRIERYADICKSPLAFIGRMREWLGPAFLPREDPDVPQQFDARPSVGFPGGTGKKYAQISTSLRADKDRYIRLVEAEYLTNRFTDHLDT